MTRMWSTCSYVISLLLTVHIIHGTKITLQPHILNHVDPSFISFTVDSGSFRRWGAFNFSSPRLHTLLTGLSPAIWRVGGSPADYLVFDTPQSKLNTSAAKKTPALTMTKNDWDNMVQLSRKCNLRLLFDLDLQQRLGAHWGLSNAVQLFDYCQLKGYGENLDWELGNEPNVYHAPDQTPLVGQQIGEDFATLSKLVKTYPNLQHGRIVGPDVVGVDDKQAKIILGYLKYAGDLVDAVTIHHYYFRGDVAKWQEYLNLEHFYSLEAYINKAYTILHHSSRPDVPLWIGETSDAWHSGTPHVSDRYISSFLWLNKLGVSAVLGVQVVMRQTFWGGHYGLVNDSLLPNPDYWMSLAHKRLVGTRVLGVISSQRPSTTKVYAHCAATRTYKAGAAIVFMMNVATNISDLITFSPDLAKEVMDVYLMTPGEPGNLLSQTVALNGKVLQMVNDDTLPELKPVSITASKGVLLPPTTYAFVVFPDANLKICQ